MARNAALAMLLVVFGCAGYANPFDTKSIGAKAEGSLYSVELTRVACWCNHMPVVAPDGAALDDSKRQHISLELLFKKKTNVRSFEYAVNAIFVSPHENFWVGRHTGDFWQEVIGPADAGDLPPDYRNGDLVIRLQCEGMFPEDSHDKTFHVAVLVAIGNESVTVRGSAVVKKTS